MTPLVASDSGRTFASERSRSFRYARIAVAVLVLNGTSRCLPPLPSVRTICALRFTSSTIEAGELAQPQTRRVEQLENRAIAARRAARRLAGAVDEPGHLLLRQMRRHADFALRRRHQRAGIVVDQPFAAEVAEKRARGRELARGRGARQAALVQLGEKAADAPAIEVRRLEGGALDAGGRGDVLEKLRQIALVRADRVRRGVAIKPEKLQKGFEMCVHASRSAGRPARDRQIASLRASLCFAAARSAGSGGMMPNVMFDGS